MLKRIIDRIALVVSIFASPYLTIPTAGLIVIMNETAGNRLVLIGTLFTAFTVVVPLLYVVIGVRAGTVSDVHVSLRSQRDNVFAVALAASLIQCLIFMSMGAPARVVAMSVALTINGWVFMMLTRHSKVSIHSGAYASSVLLVSLLVDFRAIALITLLPVVIWARLRRGRHDLCQTLVAAAISATATIGTLLLTENH